VVAAIKAAEARVAAKRARTITTIKFTLDGKTPAREIAAGVFRVRAGIARSRPPKKLVRSGGREDDEGLMAAPNSSSDSIDVTYVADLARLRLSAEEIATFQKQLGDVLGYVKQLEKVDVSGVSLLGDADLKNRLRADELKPSLSVEEALANAPRQENNLFVVPRMVE
jgi:aspartyl-tRNA(Asn)/glutamyl-tRNA(Gln) amidotransferase subunit C